MRFVLLISAALTGSGLVMAKIADTPEPAKAAVAAPQPSTAPAGSRKAQIAADGTGHFRAEGNVEGRRLDFLVDTGASIVALTETDAGRIGIRTGANDPKVTLQTANGKVSAARVRLSWIEVGDVRIRDVDAVVLPDHALKQNLLGMSFLSRTSRYEVRSGQLMIEQ